MLRPWTIGYRVRRGRKGDEKRVALCVNLNPVEPRNRIANHGSNSSQDFGEPLRAQVLQQPRRPLDIREKQSHLPRWKYSTHRLIIGLPLG